MQSQRLLYSRVAAAQDMIGICVIDLVIDQHAASCRMPEETNKHLFHSVQESDQSEGSSAGALGTGCLSPVAGLSAALQHAAALLKFQSTIHIDSETSLFLTAGPEARTSACHALMMRVYPLKSWCTASMTARMPFSGLTT